MASARMGARRCTHALLLVLSVLIGAPGAGRLFHVYAQVSTQAGAARSANSSGPPRQTANRDGQDVFATCAVKNNPLACLAKAGSCVPGKDVMVNKKLWMRPEWSPRPSWESQHQWLQRISLETGCAAGEVR